MWHAVILASTLGIAKIRSNLHASQYAGSSSSDQSQGQTLVEPLLLPGVTRHQQVSLQNNSKKDRVLAIHPSGFNYNWLKAAIVKKSFQKFFSCTFLQACIIF